MTETMANEPRVLDTRGSNVDEAVEKGLASLGLRRADVEIEVLDEGSSGFLGIGSRDAVVRLIEKVAPESVEVTPAEPPVEEVDQVSEIAPSVEEPVPVEEEPAAGPEDQREGEVAQEVVSTLLEKMRIAADVELRLTEPDDLTGEQRWLVDVTGQDLGIVIGARGETLNALQYLARLMTGHLMRGRPSFIVDVEGYRQRREQALARLAHRMADKVVKRGRAVSLEPMPPNERRIIHITLRDHDQVYTESTGQGNRRRVRILLK